MGIVESFTNRVPLSEDDCGELSRAEMRTGKVTWDYMAEAPIPESVKLNRQRATDFIAAQDVPGMPPEFWRGIMIAAAASSVMWVGGFYLLAWWFS